MRAEWRQGGARLWRGEVHTSPPPRFRPRGGLEPLRTDCLRARAWRCARHRWPGRPPAAIAARCRPCTLEAGRRACASAPAQACRAGVARKCVRLRGMRLAGCGGIWPPPCYARATPRNGLCPPGHTRRVNFIPSCGVSILHSPAALALGSRRRVFSLYGGGVVPAPWAERRARRARRLNLAELRLAAQLPTGATGLSILAARLGNSQHPPTRAVHLAECSLWGLARALGRAPRPSSLTGCYHWT